jgi:hypothetical protein
MRPSRVWSAAAQHQSADCQEAVWPTRDRRIPGIFSAQPPAIDRAGQRAGLTLTELLRYADQGYFSFFRPLVPAVEWYATELGSKGWPANPISGSLVCKLWRAAAGMPTSRSTLAGSRNGRRRARLRSVIPGLEGRDAFAQRANKHLACRSTHRTTFIFGRLDPERQYRCVSTADCPPISNRCVLVWFELGMTLHLLRETSDGSQRPLSQREDDTSFSWRYADLMT